MESALRFQTIALTSVDFESLGGRGVLSAVTTLRVREQGEA